MTLIELIEWGLFALAPILAVYTALGIYNAFAASRRREIISERDARNEREFELWWGSVEAHRGIVPVFCPIKSLADETCYLFVDHALLYKGGAANMPPEIDPKSGAEVEDGERPVFDVECGVTVGRNWSVLDMFDTVRFLGPCCIGVMKDRVCIKGGLNALVVPLDEITSVVASCSALMIEAKGLDHPLLFGCVNGQRLRDTIHILMGGNDEIRPLE